MYTDTFQAAVTVLAMMVIVLLGVQQLGGFDKIWDVAKAGSRLHFSM